MPFVETFRRPAQSLEAVLRNSRETAPQHAVFAVLVGASYFLGAKLGIALTFQPQPVSTLWLPNAILLGGLLLLPTASWWLVLAAALPAHLLVEINSGIPLPMVLCWFVSNCSEALIGAACVRRFARYPFRLDRLANVGIFVAAGFAATLLSSLLDAFFVTLNGWGDSPFWAVFRHRAMSNSLAIFTVVPVIIALPTLKEILRLAPISRYLEAIVLATGLVLVGLKVFGGQQVGPQTVPALLYAPIPLLLWAAVRFGAGGSALAVLFVVVLSTWNAVHGRGPFHSQSAYENALSIQLLFLMISITLMSLAAVIEDDQQAHDAVRQKREKLQLALDAAHMGTWDWRLPGDIALWSRESLRILGLPSADARISLQQLLNVILPSDRTQFWRAVSRSRRNGSPLDVEFRVVRPDQSIRWMSSRGKVLSDSHGRANRMIGIITDVTDRKAAEALRAQENQILEMIASGAPLRETLTSLVNLIEADTPGLLCSIVLLESDGVHLRHYAAPSLPSAYIDGADSTPIGPKAGSCGTAMFLGRPVICSDIERDPLWEDYRDLALQHGLRACWSTPFVSEKGEVLGTFAIYTRQPRVPTPHESRIIETATQLGTIALERKRAETETHEQRRALTHLARVAILGELTGSLVHELTQPLTAMLSNAQAAQRLIAQEPPRIKDVREILADIVSADRRASEVIQRLRAMLTKGQTQLAPLALNEVVTEILGLLRADLVAREVQVTTRLSAGLPLVLGDRIQLQQVLLNLVINACDAMSGNAPEERRLAIVTREAVNHQVELSIGDRGTGIQESMIDRIFEPFFTSKEHGLGLGLSICRSIVLAHRGQLSATNNEQRGATFHLTLPILSAGDQKIRALEPAPLAKKMLEV